MTPLVTTYVVVASGRLFGFLRSAADVGIVAWQVFIVGLAVMSARALVWNKPKRVVEI